MSSFPVIDPAATGANIRRLRMARGLSVRDLQRYFGFEEPRAIYKWQKGDSLPSVDNLYALGRLFAVPLEEILVPAAYSIASEQQAAACCSPLFWGRCAGARRTSGRRTPDAPSAVTNPGPFGVRLLAEAAADRFRVVRVAVGAEKSSFYWKLPVKRAFPLGRETQEGSM